jgi:hypothetical protein
MRPLRQTPLAAADHRVVENLARDLAINWLITLSWKCMAWALRALIRCGLSQTQSNPSHALRPSLSIPDSNGLDRAIQ